MCASKHLAPIAVARLGLGVTQRHRAHSQPPGSALAVARASLSRAVEPKGGGLRGFPPNPELQRTRRKRRAAELVR
jgi:hypothetical protein